MTNLPAFFQSSIVVYLPVAVVLTFTLLLIPGLLVTGAKPEQVAKAVSSYMVKTFGLILIALSVVQVTYGLVMMSLPEQPMLAGLVLLFVSGIGLMVYESRVIAGIDEASVSVVRAIFTHTCEIIGFLVAAVSGLSIMMTFLLTETLEGWEMSGSLLLLGLLLMLSSSMHMRRKTGSRKVAKKK